MSPTHTIFIDNIPPLCRLGTVWKAFHSFGHILDLRLPKTRRIKSNSRFGFIVYRSRKEADHAVKSMNGAKLDGHILGVELAHPPRPRFNPSPQATTWCRSEGFSSLDPHRSAPSPPSPPPHPPPPPSPPPLLAHPPPKSFAPTEEILDLSHSPLLHFWLRSCVHLVTAVDQNPDEIKEELPSKLSVSVKGITMLTPKSFLIFLHPEAKVDDFLADTSLQPSFIFTQLEQPHLSPPRIATLAIRGIHPYAWCKDSVMTIAKNFGEIVSCDNDFSAIPRTLDAHVCIATHIQCIINNEVHVRIDETVFKVGVVEFWSEELGERDPKKSPSPSRDPDITAIGNPLPAASSPILNQAPLPQDPPLNAATINDPPLTLDGGQSSETEELPNTPLVINVPPHSMEGGQTLPTGQPPNGSPAFITASHSLSDGIHSTPAQPFQPNSNLAAAIPKPPDLSFIPLPCQKDGQPPTVLEAPGISLISSINNPLSPPSRSVLSPELIWHPLANYLPPENDRLRPIPCLIDSPQTLQNPPKRCTITETSQEVVGVNSPALDLKVVLSPVTLSPSQAVSSRHFPSFASPTPTLPFLKGPPSSEKCFDFGLWLNCHIPNPELSKASYSKTLRRSSRIASRLVKVGSSQHDKDKPIKKAISAKGRPKRLKGHVQGSHGSR